MKISVVIPSSPTMTRTDTLQRALHSVLMQQRRPDFIHVSIDHERRGAAINRQRGLDRVDTELTAFLDDDDEFRPHHLRLLHDFMVETDADLVYPWFEVAGGIDPFPMHEGKPWDNNNPVQFPITYLAKTEALRKAGGFVDVPDGPTHEDGNRAGEDWRLQLRLIETGAKIVHLPIRTWIWHHDSGNTSGLAEHMWGPRATWGDGPWNATP